MNEVQIPNLDYLAAKYSQELVSGAVDGGVKAKVLDTNITKMLGILQENGVYGCFLFALSRSGDRNKEPGDEEKKSFAQAVYVALELLNNTPAGQSQLTLADDDQHWLWVNGNKAAILQHISAQFCRDLHRNYLAQTVLERCLIYTRYHAKAMKEG